MLATIVRVRPWSARSSPRSVGRVTEMTPSSCAIDIRCGTCARSSPLGPCTVTRPGSTVTVTPAGTSIGCLPILDTVTPNPDLPDETDHFAADALGLGGAARDHAAGRGQDCSSHASEDAGKAILAGVDPAARLGDALEAREHALAAAPVLELDHEHLVGQLAGGLDMVVAHVALLLKDAGDLFLELGARHLGAVVQRLVS